MSGSQNIPKCLFSRTIYEKRQLDGSLNRVPMNFYEQVWYILNKSPLGIKIYDYHLPQVGFYWFLKMRS
jgi:hypothetical protein